MSFKIKRNTLNVGLDSFDLRIVEAVHTLLDYYSTVAVSEMRAGARWTDRTTNARNGLAAKVFKRDDGGSIVLFHTVPYGIWLEVRWSGKYAIIGPVRDSVAPRLMATLKQAIEKAAQR